MLEHDPNIFANRHIGIDNQEMQDMLAIMGLNSAADLIKETIPSQIRKTDELNIPEAISEHLFSEHIHALARKNVIKNTFIGQGYYGTITPAVLLRNIFQNPGWYTQYTPYQAEISQGRMEALLNFQTVVSDLTKLPIANASLLDEGTAAAEAMAMFYNQKNKRSKDKIINKFFVDTHVFKQTKEIIALRAEPLGIEIVTGDWNGIELTEDYFGALVQYPNSQGVIEDYRAFAKQCNDSEIYLTVAADILSLVLLTPPGEWGADACVGSTQRLGVPIGYGGPHAAYFSTREKFKRQIPGRIIGLSKDVHGNPAFRMALQTREQHIKRERATSNICTAQALLAIMASMYAVYHGQEGLIYIASRIQAMSSSLKDQLELLGFDVVKGQIFDTVTVRLSEDKQERLRASEYNFYYDEDCVSISFDETKSFDDVSNIIKLMCEANDMKADLLKEIMPSYNGISQDLERRSDFLEHPTFKKYRTETEMMRYIKSLENKDLSLMHSMIPLGSCTMKLNAAAELLPVSIPEFANLHPFAPFEQAKGYEEMINSLEEYLCEITGFEACSLQPNSGAQGEYAGLMVIRAYHNDNSNSHRNIALIPSSAHGTNPASAVMAGMQVVVVACDENGNIDLDDLKNKAEAHKDELAALMITYPSTHGVFEEEIQSICRTIHNCGGLVYMDGANMNAQVGLTSPGIIGADVCHLNLHKTFAIPHGGGGPGMGPICVNEKLKTYLPGHFVLNKSENEKQINAVSAAPFGSASILLISYAYIRLLGVKGLKQATISAIINANYIKERLTGAFEILYLGKNGRTAHELILDLRPYKAIGISAEDVAKRLMDYGFHAPTLSFPVAGTIMIEPTESESKEEIDRFCDAMLEIKKEIDEVANGSMSVESNTLVNAPHTMHLCCGDDWPYDYSREKAAFPLPYLKVRNKFWASVARVDNAYGDRNLICTCPSIEEYA